MASKSTSVPAGIERLTKLLSHLNKAPRLTLPGVKSLSVSYAFRNDHFGARHFVKKDLPRIRWANPELDIDVKRPHKEVNERWKPELIVTFDQGLPVSFSLQDKHSSTILKELMNAAGGEPWAAYVRSRKAAGLPIIEGEHGGEAGGEEEGRVKEKEKGQYEEMEAWPNWEEFQEKHPEAGKSRSLSGGASKAKAKKKEGKAKKKDKDKGKKDSKETKKEAKTEVKKVEDATEGVNEVETEEPAPVTA
ncbi:unnamed protein product [Cyclocybe aegerita]|uniref:Ribosomal protein/NADH dehydrogenase domain-containing protein n=1 Tax=Cyclocybe aegerita TaxID=1973307 RepID=A0A8S0XPD8_CYCAE|nr:unnamed protein product [Cyclocybe aegerita]